MLGSRVRKRSPVLGPVLDSETCASVEIASVESNESLTISLSQCSG